MATIIGLELRKRGRNMELKGVIDRIVDGKMVLLMGDDETELIVDASITTNVLQEGQWVLVTIDNDSVIEIKADPEENQLVEERIKEKLAKLKKKQGSQFIIRE